MIWLWRAAWIVLRASVRTRFAPSPTGYLHLGHAASALQAFSYAQEHDGVCLLRIEDIDTTRCRPEYTTAIYEDLDWLGFDWPLPVRRQSQHFADYRQVLERLRDMGLVYRCFKTRKEILEDIARAPHTYDAPYCGPETPLSTREENIFLDEGKPFAWRLSLRACRMHLGSKYTMLSFINNGETVFATPDLLGDVILGRKDVGTSYHLACTHDDALQGITDIVRGEDLYESTHIHRLLQEILGWPVPIYHHHKLLMDAEGKRFAKRDQAQTLRSLRGEFLRPENILARVKELG